MKTSWPPWRGFTLIEAIIVLAVFSLLSSLVASNMGTWMQSARIRMTADYIEGGLRQAQAEAIKQSRVVAFVLTDSPAYGTTLPAPTSAASASYWYAATLPWTTYTAAAINNALTLVAAAEVSTDAQQVSVAGVPTLCFSSYGRPTTTFTPASSTGISCSAASAVYTIGPSASGSSTAHNLEVTVSSAGQIRMCNPNKPIANYPDGC